jgi:hypothetical protein
MTRPERQDSIIVITFVRGYLLQGVLCEKILFDFGKGGICYILTFVLGDTLTSIDYLYSPLVLIILFIATHKYSTAIMDLPILEDSRDTTMASRAGLKSSTREQFLKNAPRISKRGFCTDWSRYEWYVEDSNCTDADATKWLPHLLDDDLFTLFQESKTRLNISSLDEAKQLLSNVVGIQKATCLNFSNRKWKEGCETLSEFMLDLQNLAAQLSIPEGMIRAQFLLGIPANLSHEIEIRVDDDC